MGMEGGQQFVNLEASTMGIAAHEILHALGIHHEQCRPDRNDFINVNLNNRHPSAGVRNWNIDLGTVGGGNFDFQSIMLYGSFDGAINNSSPVITRLNGTAFNGQRNAHSAGDIAGVKALYPLISGANIVCNVNISNPSSTTPTITKTGNGVVNLNATITRGGNNFTVSKQVHVGTGTYPSILGDVTTPGYSGPLAQFNCVKTLGAYYSGVVNINVPDPSFSVSWQLVSKTLPSTIALIPSNGQKSGTVQVFPQGHHAVVRITVTSPCGGSTSSDHYFIADGTCEYGI